VRIKQIIHFPEDEEPIDIVELKTRHRTISVTADHRIAVPSRNGNLQMIFKEACQLQVGDFVYCGQATAALVKVSQYRRRTAIVCLRFSPDVPVECFFAPRWSILTMGDEDSPPCTDDGFSS